MLFVLASNKRKIQMKLNKNKTILNTEKMNLYSARAKETKNQKQNLLFQYSNIYKAPLSTKHLPKSSSVKLMQTKTTLLKNYSQKAQKVIKPRTRNVKCNLSIPNAFSWSFQNNKKSFGSITHVPNFAKILLNEQLNENFKKRNIVTSIGTFIKKSNKSRKVQRSCSFAEIREEINDFNSKSKHKNNSRGKKEKRSSSLISDSTNSTSISNNFENAKKKRFKNNPDGPEEIHFKMVVIMRKNRQIMGRIADCLKIQDGIMSDYLEY